MSNTVVTFTAPTLTANATAGNDVVSVSADGETIPVFSLANTPGGAATIIASTGGGQTAPIGTVFLTTLSTVVMDLHPNPVPGVAVSFVAPDTGATVTTDSNGVAIAPAFTANTRAGSYTVSATAAGGGVPTTFSLTNTPAPPPLSPSPAFPPRSSPVSHSPLPSPPAMSAVMSPPPTPAPSPSPAPIPPPPCPPPTPSPPPIRVSTPSSAPC